jgi:hypothetical protein
MELKEFIKKALSEIIEAVDEVSDSASREVYLQNTEGSRSVEFDVAVTASEKGTNEGGAGIRVLHFVELGGSKSSEVTNTTVSRVRFGVTARSWKKGESGVHVSKPYINHAR